MEKSVEMADSFLKGSSKKLGEAESHLGSLNYPESISASQECIELSIKAVFLLLQKEYPKRHEFRDEEFGALLERVPERLRYLDFHRLFLISKFWLGLYSTAKYGEERLGIGPEKLFKGDEAKLALAHAKECNRAAVILRDYIRHPY